MNEGTKKEIISWVKTFVFAVVFALCFNSFIIVNAEVPTGSMEPTIMTDDRIMGFRLAYLFDKPKRFDIVIFKQPDNEKENFVKRIIGMPGETVEIKDGKVYINESETPLEDSFVNGVAFGDYGPYEVPDGHYFMLGDNRNGSIDSRVWENKYLSEDKILGEAKFRYFPSFKLFNKYYVETEMEN